MESIARRFELPIVVLGVAGMVFLGGCGGDDNGNPNPNGEFSITLTGLEPLPVDHHYEAWARFAHTTARDGMGVEHGDEIPVSLGAFQVTSEGEVQNLDGGPMSFQLAESHELNPVDVVVSIREAEPDTTIGSVILGGDVGGDDHEGRATLTTEYHDAWACDIRTASGTCILATPTDTDTTTANERQGIWFATPAGLPALNLPVLGEGWHYDAYVILGAKEISIGHFPSADVEDSDGKGLEAGPGAGFTTPGSDFVVSQLDFSQGTSSILISLTQSDEHGHEGRALHDSILPFHVLELEIPAGTLPHTPMVLQTATEPLPAGTVSFVR
jgi:hypothetical protein